jgi:hypothetical protein
LIRRRIASALLSESLLLRPNRDQFGVKSLREQRSVIAFARVNSESFTPSMMQPAPSK